MLVDEGERDAVESVLKELPAARDGEEPYTVVTSAETAVTPHAEELEERLSPGPRRTTASRPRRFGRLRSA
jgi:hypothetical protein